MSRIKHEVFRSPKERFFENRVKRGISCWGLLRLRSQRSLLIIALIIGLSTSAFAQLSGEYTVGSGGNYTTLTAALAAWKNSTITGHVTFRLLNASYTGETYPLRCTIPAGYSGGNWTLTIKPASGIMSNFTGSAVSPLPIFDLRSVQRVTIDSVVFTNTGTGPALRFIAGASHNTIKNCSLKARPTSTTVGVVLFSTSTGATGNNNNLIENCDITTSLPGTSYPHTCINFNGSASPSDNQNNIIKGCRIYDFATRGISFIANASNTIITENEIFTRNTQTGATLIGIHFTSSLTNTIHGTQIIRNKIFNLRTSSTAAVTLAGIQNMSSGSSTPNLVANNFISLNEDTNHTTAHIFGIDMWFESDHPTDRIWNIYYNSIYIGGTDEVAIRVSAGLRRSSGGTGTFNFMNNIIFNNRSTDTARVYGIRYEGSAVGFNSNYNNIHVTNAGVGPRYIGLWGGDYQPLLSDWQNASGQDMNSISADPNFLLTNTSDLHINPNSNAVNRKATPISGITIDIDGQPRHITRPDIGADEYTPNAPGAVTLLEPTSNAINQPLTGRLRWDKVTAAAFYDVYLEDANPPQKVSSLQPDTGYTYLSLNANTKYYWQIVAWNDTSLAKGSSASNIDSFTTLSPPNAPSDLILSDIMHNSMRLSWNDNSTDELGFYIRRDISPTGSFPIVHTVGPNDTMYEPSNLGPNTHYYWRVSAYNDNGESDFTAADTWTLAQIPGPVILTEVTYKKMKMTLSPLANPGSTEFMVRVSYTGNNIKYVDPTSNVLVDNPVWGTYAQFGGAGGRIIIGLLPGVNYTFEAKARNGINIETDYGSPTYISTPTPISGYPYFQNFEGPSVEPQWASDTALRYYSGFPPLNDWILGTPWKQYIQGAYSGDKCWVTDLFMPYSDRHNAFVITPGFNFSGLTQPPKLSFYHNFDTETGTDACVVEYTTDEITWTRLMPDQFALNWYNTFLPGNPAITPPYWAGRSNGWIKSSYVLSVLTGQPFVRFRMRFVSDNWTVLGDGWAFDDFKIETYRDIATTAINRPLLNEQKRVSFQPQVTVINNSEPGMPPENIDVVAEIWTVQIGLNESFESMTFPPLGWVRYDNDGGGGTWHRVAMHPRTGIASARSMSESSILRNDDWLVTLQIAVQPGDTLRFWYRTDYVLNDTLEVWLSTSGNTIPEFTVRLDAFGIRTTTYTEKVIPLDAYAGQNVYIAFVNKGLYNWGYIYLDDVTIGTDVLAPALVYCDTVFDLPVSSGKATAQAYFDPVAINIEGNYLFKTWTIFPEDMNPFNNLISRNFTVELIPLTLIEPKDDTLIKTIPTFRWSSVEGATSYRIQVWTDSKADTIINEVVEDPFFDTPLDDGTYYWRVRVESPGTPDPYSETWNFTLDYLHSISGTITDGAKGPMPGVTVTATGGFNGSDETDEDGNYTIENVPTGTEDITLTPTKTGYGFTPGHIDIPGPVENDITGQDFTGALLTYSISGTITTGKGPIAGVLVTATDGFSGSDETDEFGYYEITGVPYGSTGILLTPTKTGYSFTPPTRTVDGPVTGNVGGQNFTGALLTYSISGTVTDGSKGPIQGVLVTATGGFNGSDETDEFGYYEIAGVPYGSTGILLTPTKTDYIFTPPTRTVTGPVTNNVTGQDFTGALSGLPGWAQKASVPTTVLGDKPKYVKDGGALTNGSEGKGDVLFALRGNKSTEFYKYIPENDNWTLPHALDSMPRKCPKHTDTSKFNTKTPGKGAALCYDGDNTIYATKGNGTSEFYAYSISGNRWYRRQFIPALKGVKGGTSMVFKDGKVYLLAGSRPKPDSNNFFAYDSTTNTWEILTKLPPGPYTKVWKDGSCLTLFNNTIYALKGGDKQSYFYRYDAPDWTFIDSIPKLEVIGMRPTTPPKEITKSTTVKDGAGMASSGNAIYVVKGGGSIALWKRTATGWSQNIQDTIPRLHSKSVVKTGGGLAYSANALWLMKGNNTAEFWKYTLSKGMLNVPTQMSKVNTTTQAFIPHSSLLTTTIDITPNPFTKLATIRYTVPVSGKVSLKLYNATGRLVETLVNEVKSAGTYSLEIRNSTLNQVQGEIPKGVYFLKYETTTDSKELKLIVE